MSFPHYLIRHFEEDCAASNWLNERVKEGYSLVSVSVAAVSDSDRDYRCIVPAIVVTVEYTRARQTAQALRSALPSYGTPRDYTDPTYTDPTLRMNPAGCSTPYIPASQQMTTGNPPSRALQVAA